MLKLSVNLQSSFRRIHPVVWYGVGFVVAYQSIRAFKSPYPGVNPFIIGLAIAFGVLSLTLARRDRPKSLWSKSWLFVVCIAAVTHGLWWSWYWHGFADWAQLQFEQMLPYGPLRYQIKHTWTGIFAGLTFASLLLAIPLGWITRSSWARTIVLVAGPLSYWWFESGVQAFPLRGMVTSMRLFQRDLVSPALSMYVLICTPLLVLAWKSLPRKESDPMKCQHCGYSLAGLDLDASCPECGTTRSHA